MQDYSPVEQSHALPWSIMINGQSIGGNIDIQLQNTIFQPRMKARWAQMFQIPSNSIH